MARFTPRILAICLAGTALASCGGGGDDTPAPAPPVVVPPPPAPRLEDGFGANFGTAFRADLNGEARDPVAGDIIPLNLATDPTTI